MFPSFPHWTLEDGFNRRVEWLLPRICFFPVQALDCYSLVPFWALLESKQLGSEKGEFTCHWTTNKNLLSTPLVVLAANRIRTYVPVPLRLELPSELPLFRCGPVETLCAIR